MSHASADGAVRREFVFLCADTGAVAALTLTDEKRPALAQAVVFLASGDTLWVDGTADGGARPALTVRDRGSGGRYDLRLSAQATLLTGPSFLVSGETAAAPRMPVGLELALEPASQQLALGSGIPPAERVILVGGAGSLAIGSVIHRLEGSAWSSTAAGASGAPAGCRARAVFQDGSALYVASEADGQSADVPVAAFVRNTRIRPATVRDFTMRRPGRGQLGRTVSWAAGGRSPVGTAAEIRDVAQQLTVTRPDPAGSDWLSWSCAPFVFVRSGVTGLGVVEQRARSSAPVKAAAAADELPDPF